MTDKPVFANGYRSEQTEIVRQTCLFVATKLGDLSSDIVVVGGLVPTLLVSPDDEGVSSHVGTRDLDLGLALGILDGERYREVSERLRRAQFEPSITTEGEQKRQRWKYARDDSPETYIDFLIPPSSPEKSGGDQQDMEEDFAAIVTPGLNLAFKDPIVLDMRGQTLLGEMTKREIQVCNPGAFVLLKSLAFGVRGENKDAYDLFYMIRNFGEGIRDVASPFVQLGEAKELDQAVEIIDRDFTNSDGPGPRRVAEFLVQGKDAELQAEVAAYCRQFLELVQ